MYLWVAQRGTSDVTSIVLICWPFAPSALVRGGWSEETGAPWCVGASAHTCASSRLRGRHKPAMAALLATWGWSTLEACVTQGGPRSASTSNSTQDVTQKHLRSHMVRAALTASSLCGFATRSGPQNRGRQQGGRMPSEEQGLSSVPAGVLPLTWPWASALASLGFCFLICEMEARKPTSEGEERNWTDASKVCSGLRL